MLLKQKESVTSQKLDSGDFRKITNCVFNKGKYAIPPLLYGLEMSSASDELILFAKTLLKDSNLAESDISSPVSSSRRNVNLHNISVTTKMVRIVVINLDSSKSSNPDCIPAGVLKKCEPGFSYILAKFFNICQKESCFSDCWKVSPVVPVFNNFRERSTAKIFHPLALLFVGF